MTSSGLLRLIILAAIPTLVFHDTLQSHGGTANQSNDLNTKGEPHSGGFELRTDTQGVDFSAYLHSVFAAIKQRWKGEVPESAKDGQSGRVTIQYRIQKDGKLDKESLQVITSSGKKDMDESCLSVIRKTAPFEPLPDTFHGAFIELRQTFDFNRTSSPK